MIEIVDFDGCEKILTRGYLGNAGRKFAVLYKGEPWMLKFPESTKNFRGKYLPSYTSSPLSEYIGSKIYESLGIPVHEVVLGRREGKIVVGCKDFAVNDELMEFRKIKNTVREESLIDGNGSSERGDKLTDVLRVMDEADIFSIIPESVQERFWDMFIVDSFILNGDRNNGNWGVLIKRYSVELAPVYDNGDSFYNKRNPSLAERRLTDESLVIQDALMTGSSFFTDDAGRHLHPGSYIAAMKNEQCNAALLRIIERIDMDAIRKIIDDIPEAAFGYSVIAPAQREHYKKLLDTVYEKVFLPTAIRLRGESLRQ